MAFKKISTLENKDLAFYTIENFKVEATSLSNSSGTSTRLSDIVLFQDRNNDLSQNSIQICMDKTTKSFTSIIKNTVENLDYTIEANNKSFIIGKTLPISDSYTFEIPENTASDTYYNIYIVNFIINTAVTIPNHGSSFISSNSENALSSIIIDNQGISGLKFNMNSLSNISVTNCTNLVTFYPSKFTFLENLTLKNNNINGPLIISKLTQNSIVNIENIGIQYLELEGSNTSFTTSNLSIKDNKLRYLRLKNCTIDQDCINNILENCESLTEDNIEIG